MVGRAIAICRESKVNNWFSIKIKRDKGGHNLSILNILSYSDLNVFWGTKITSTQKNYDAIQIMQDPSF